MLHHHHLYPPQEKSDVSTSQRLVVPSRVLVDEDDDDDEDDALDVAHPLVLVEQWQRRLPQLPSLLFLASEEVVEEEEQREGELEETRSLKRVGPALCPS